MKVVQVRRLQLLAACFGTLLAACDSSELRGQLVLTFQTDMAMPKQIDTVDVRVMLRGNRVQYMNSYAVGPGSDEYRVPGTLTLLAGKDPNLPITVRIAGSKDNRWRTYREITTTVPSDRVAELRMPIQWLCNESAMPQPVSEPDGMGGTITRIVSQCDDGTTCKAGRCVPNTVDSGTLPDYDPGNTFGGAGSPENGVCFDTIACLSGGAAVVPDDDCTVSKPDGERINLGLRVADGGICDSENTTCFVPLDGRSDECTKECEWPTTCALPCTEPLTIRCGNCDLGTATGTCNPRTGKVDYGECSGGGECKAGAVQTCTTPEPESLRGTSTCSTMCSWGTCVANCGMDEHRCDGKCVPINDRNHCGRCGNACAPDEVCSAGSCGTQG